jgi:hypothetical protein
MNREDAGSLLAQAQTIEETESANYWRKRATIYIIGTVFVDQFLHLTLERLAFHLLLPGPNEYFYRRSNRGQDSSSTASSMSTDEPRRGGPEEFEQMAQRYHEQRRTQH